MVKRPSKLIAPPEPRRLIALDETKLKRNGKHIFVWAQWTLKGISAIRV